MLLYHEVFLMRVNTWKRKVRATRTIQKIKICTHKTTKINKSHIVQKDYIMFLILDCNLVCHNNLIFYSFFFLLFYSFSLFISTFTVSQETISSIIIVKIVNEKR